MLRVTVLAALLSAAAAGVLTADVLAAEEGVVVEELIFCLGVEDRQPVGANTQFLETVERIYCFTRIVGAADPTAVTHVWYYGDEEQARVDLAVRSASWRTWSSKTMLDAWTGAWRVDVLGADGEVLKSGEFVYRPAGD